MGGPAPLRNVYIQRCKVNEVDNSQNQEMKTCAKGFCLSGFTIAICQSGAFAHSFMNSQALIEALHPKGVYVIVNLRIVKTTSTWH